MNYRWLVCALIGLSIPSSAADLRAYTEEFPPFNYTENGQAKGFANAVLNTVALRVNLTIQRKVYPWARAVLSNHNDANSLLFTTMRTPEREAQYRWIGPIDACDVVLLKISQRQDIQIKNTTDLQSYRIAYAKDSATEEVLKGFGVSANKRFAVSSTSSAMPMLYAGHVDLVSGIHIAHAFNAKRLNLPAEQLNVAYTLKKGFGCYFAFNPKVEPRLFNRFQAAFLALEQSGELQKIRQDWITSEPRSQLQLYPLNF